MTGLDLRLRRTAARVKTRDLAEAMRVVPSRVSQIEALAEVTDEMSARYLEALARIALETSATKPTVVPS